jgi:hypothetical protein
VLLLTPDASEHAVRAADEVLALVLARNPGFPVTGERPAVVDVQPALVETLAGGSKPAMAAGRLPGRSVGFVLAAVRAGGRRAGDPYGATDCYGRRANSEVRQG